MGTYHVQAGTYDHLVYYSAMSGELMKIDQKEIAMLGNRFRLMKMGRKAIHEG